MRKHEHHEDVRLQCGHLEDPRIQSSRSLSSVDVVKSGRIQPICVLLICINGYPGFRTRQDRDRQGHPGTHVSEVNCSPIAQGTDDQRLFALVCHEAFTRLFSVHIGTDRGPNVRTKLKVNS